jgi:nucleoid-associated protein YgaU
LLWGKERGVGKDVKIGIGVALSIGLLLFVFLVIRGGNEGNAVVPTAPPTSSAAPSASVTRPSAPGPGTSAATTPPTSTGTQSAGAQWTTLPELELVEPAPATQERTAEAEIVGTPAKPGTPAVRAPAGTKVEPPAPLVTTTPSAGGLTGGSQVVQVTAPAAAPQTYTTEKGDTLWSLATRFYSDGRRWKKIYEANRDVLTSSSDVPVGAVLLIPAAEAEPAAAEAQTSSTARTPALAAGEKTYTVEQRDTLYSIARKEYGDASLWRVIYEANRERIPAPEQLPVGAVLVIPPASEK